MWVVITGVDGFSIAAIGSTSMTRPSGQRRNPTGVCIHAFAVTTNHALARPDDRDGTPTTSVPTARAGPSRRGRCRGRSPR